MDRRLLMQSGTAQIIIGLAIDSQPGENVIYIENLEKAIFIDDYGVVAMSDDRLKEYCNRIADSWATNMASQLANSTKLVSVVGYWNEAVGVGPLHEAIADSGSIGTIATNGAALPNNVAVCAKLATSLVGRAYHGRTYWGAVGEADTDSDAPNILTPAAAISWENQMAAFVSDIQTEESSDGLGAPPFHKAQLVVASFQDKTRIGAVPPYYFRDVALTTNATGYVLRDVVLDSMKTRLPGR